MLLDVLKINQSINDFIQVSEYIAKDKDHYSNKGHLQKLKKNYTTAGDILNRRRAYHLGTIPRNMKLRNSWGLNKVKVVNLVQHTLSKGTGTERYKLMVW